MGVNLCNISLQGEHDFFNQLNFLPLTLATIESSIVRLSSVSAFKSKTRKSVTKQKFIRPRKTSTQNIQELGNPLADYF